MTNSPSIAILIAAHDRPAHLARLLKALEQPAVHVFLHIDSKSKLAPPNVEEHPNVTICEPAIAVHWGGFSQVEATLFLMRQATAKGDFNHFVLISGSDFPLRPMSEIVEFFSDHPEAVFLHAEPMPGAHKPLSRVKYYHPQPSDPAHLRAWHRLKRRLLKPLARRDFAAALDGRKLYGGTSWWAMPVEVVTYILQTFDNDPGLLEFFRSTHCPDEMVFQILVMNSPFAKSCRNTLSWADWSQGGAHPAAVRMDHIPQLKDIGARREYLFARKFPDDSAALLEDLTAHWPQDLRD